MDFDINRDLAEDAAEDYSDDPDTRAAFADGWLHFCELGERDIKRESQRAGYHFLQGFIAARDAPDD